MKLLLGVNVDHVATLRQARGTDYPSPLEAAIACKKAGADGITIHLREDRRHIVDADVYAMKEKGPLPLNLEMANTPEIVKIALAVKPEEVCLVPEKRQELTTEGGLDVAGNRAALAPTIKALSDAGIIVSLFVDPDPEQLKASMEVGAPVVELHTGTYCDAPVQAQEKELDLLREGARFAHEQGLQVNAGHGINMQNIAGILALPHLNALNIGHSIIARAVMLGMEQAVREMIEAMDAYRGGNE